jgi:hypothetical protein
MHWILWAILACFVFLATYNPRTGNLTKYFAPEVSVEGNASRAPQSDSNTDEQGERRPALSGRP